MSVLTQYTPFFSWSRRLKGQHTKTFRERGNCGIQETVRKWLHTGCMNALRYTKEKVSLLWSHFSVSACVLTQSVSATYLQQHHLTQSDLVQTYCSQKVTQLSMIDSGSNFNFLDNRREKLTPSCSAHS